MTSQASGPAPAPRASESGAFTDGLELTTVHDPRPNHPVALTVILPTRNESKNIPVLFELLAPALADLSGELIVVDDSDDDTGTAVTRSAAGTLVPVRLLHRRVGERHGGLGGAVIAGARHARGRWVLVMDADLQ